MSHQKLGLKTDELGAIYFSEPTNNALLEAEIKAILIVYQRGEVATAARKALWGLEQKPKREKATTADRQAGAKVQDPDQRHKKRRTKPHKES